MRKPGDTHPKEIVDTVRRLAADGWSASEIGAELNKTRNAICGIAHRAKPKIVFKCGRRNRWSPAPRPRAPRAGSKNAPRTKPEKKPPSPLPRVATASIIVRAPREVPSTTPQCLWHGCMKDAMRAGKPYCVEHHLKSGGLL